MFYIYILYSQKLDKFYVGSSGNIELRVTRHNAGLSKFSSRGIPWKLVYFEEFNSKSEALRREREIKSKKSRMYIEKLIVVREVVPNEIREVSSAPPSFR